MDPTPVQTAKKFISYAREDSEFVLKLAMDLRRAGANIWLDRLDIPVGANWPEAIEKALDSCGHFLVILSPASVGSPNVNAEMNFALDEGKQIFPVLRHECKRPFRIRAVQYADFTGDYQSGLAELLRSVGVGPEPEATPVVTRTVQAAEIQSAHDIAPLESPPDPVSPSTEPIAERVPATHPDTAEEKEKAENCPVAPETVRPTRPRYSRTIAVASLVLVLVIVGWWVASRNTQSTGPTLIAILDGHKNVVESAQFSPDGHRIITASVDTTARVWDATNGRLLLSLGNTDQVTAAMISPDGRRLVTSSVDGATRMWDAANGQLLARLEGRTDGLYWAEFSPDGQRILTGGLDHTIRIWSVATGELVGKLNDVRQTAFCSDNQRIFSFGVNGTVQAWNAANGQLRATISRPMGDVSYAVFSPDCQRIIVARTNKEVWLWGAANGKMLTALEGNPDSIRQAVFSHDGQRIAAADEHNNAWVWNSNGQLVAKLTGHWGGVYSVAFSPDRQLVVTAAGDKTARVWNAANGQLLGTLQGHTGNVFDAAFSPDGQRIVTASGDYTARVWNVANLPTTP